MAAIEAVRAWADYDEWRVFGECIRGSWRAECWPMGATGERGGFMWDDDLPAVIQHMEQLGALRSLRVLLSTGNQIEFVRKGDSVTIAQGRRAVMLEPGCMKFSLFSEDGAWLHGGWYMPEVTDTDAVARAIAEAVAWLQRQEIPA